jgi:NADH-quinone oxidoreductase subunit N
LAVLAAATATVGNLAALGQTNLKRLLAYSTIAHAGYMLMALAALSIAGVQTVLFYLAAYFVTNLGAFACVAFLRNLTGSEDLSTMAGMIHRAPLLVVAFAISLLSLLGLPPLAGFAAKFQVFAVVYDAGGHNLSTSPMLSYTYYGLLTVAAINTVISAAYYLRILRIMVLDAPAESATALRCGCGVSLFSVVLAILVILAGILWNPLVDAGHRAVNSGQWSGNSGQWSGNSGQWSGNSGQWSVGSGQLKSKSVPQSGRK